MAYVKLHPLTIAPGGDGKQTGITKLSQEDQAIYDILNTGAIGVVNTPAGNIAATTVQAAINELDTKKSPLDIPTFTGNVSTYNSVLTPKGYLFKNPSSNWGMVTTGLYITPRDAINACHDFSLSLWNGSGSIIDRLLINGSTGALTIGGVAETSLATYGGLLKIFGGPVNGPQAICGIEMPSSNSGYGAKIYTNNSTDSFGIATRWGSATWTERLIISEQTGKMSVGGVCSPMVDNSVTSGEAGYRWSQIWAATATINTSDERTKNTITSSNLGLDFISNLRPVSYKFNVGQNIVTQEPDGEEEITVKEAVWNLLTGELISPAIKEMRTKSKQVITPRPGARTHYGLIAQEVKTVLGDTDFGGYIYDEATDAYGLRYEEFIAPLIKAVQELTARVKVLEAK